MHCCRMDLSLSCCPRLLLMIVCKLAGSMPLNAVLRTLTWLHSVLQEEFVAIMLPQHSRGRSSNGIGKHQQQHVALAHAGSVPSEVNWANTGAGKEVTDQAVCGSCWAFSTAAALQGAVYMKTGAVWATATVFCLSICLSVSMSVCLCLSVCLSVCLSCYVSVDWFLSHELRCR